MLFWSSFWDALECARSCKAGWFPTFPRLGSLSQVLRARAAEGTCVPLKHVLATVNCHLCVVRQASTVILPMRKPNSGQLGAICLKIGVILERSLTRASAPGPQKAGSSCDPEYEPHTYIFRVHWQLTHARIRAVTPMHTFSHPLKCTLTHLHELPGQHTARAPTPWVFPSWVVGPALGHLWGTIEPKCSGGSPPSWTKWTPCWCTQKTSHWWACSWCCSWVSRSPGGR